MEINGFFLSEDLFRSILHSFFRRSPVRDKYVWRDTFMSVPWLVTVIYGRMATRGGFMSVSVCVCACVCTYLCAMPTPLMPCQLKHEVTVEKAKIEKLRKWNSKNLTVFENVCCVKSLASTFHPGEITLLKLIIQILDIQNKCIITWKKMIAVWKHCLPGIPVVCKLVQYQDWNRCQFDFDFTYGVREVLI